MEHKKWSEMRQGAATCLGTAVTPEVSLWSQACGVPPFGNRKGIAPKWFFSLLLFFLSPLRGKEVSKRGNAFPTAKPNLLLEAESWYLHPRGGVLTPSAPRSGKPELKSRFKASFRSVTANNPAGVKGGRTRRWKVPSQASHHQA